MSNWEKEKLREIEREREKWKSYVKYANIDLRSVDRWNLGLKGNTNKKKVSRNSEPKHPVSIKSHNGSQFTIVKVS